MKQICVMGVLITVSSCEALLFMLKKQFMVHFRCYVFRVISLPKKPLDKKTKLC